MSNIYAADLVLTMSLVMSAGGNRQSGSVSAPDIIERLCSSLRADVVIYLENREKMVLTSFGTGMLEKMTRMYLLKLEY